MPAPTHDESKAGSADEHINDHGHALEHAGLLESTALPPPTTIDLDGDPR